MELNAKIFVAGHRGMVGSAIVANLKNKGFDNIVERTSYELNLINVCLFHHKYTIFILMMDFYNILWYKYFILG